MCGRYTMTSPDELSLEFEVGELPEDLVPRFNIAPTQMAPVVLQRDAREIRMLRWGLIPSWAKDMSIGHKLINARSETVHEKPSFRSAFKKRRCLVCADGFYEWKKEGAKKVPHFIHRVDGRPIAFAGLWERWRDKHFEASPEIHTFTILTTNPNELMKPLHDRMPVIIPPEDYARWLAPEIHEREALEDLFIPIGDAGLEAYEVSSLVSSPKNDSPACIERGPAQQSLF